MKKKFLIIYFLLGTIYGLTFGPSSRWVLSFTKSREVSGEWSKIKSSHINSKDLTFVAYSRYFEKNKLVQIPLDTIIKAKSSDSEVFDSSNHRVVFFEGKNINELKTELGGEELDLVSIDTEIPFGVTYGGFEKWMNQISCLECLVEFSNVPSGSYFYLYVNKSINLPGSNHYVELSGKFYNVEGNSVYYGLLPISFAFDALTWPLQSLMWINYSSSH